MRNRVHLDRELPQAPPGAPAINPNIGEVTKDP
jgi:hypothetical protein